jgi:Kef-type K+ transport system membrane component KefB
MSSGNAPAYPIFFLVTGLSDQSIFVQGLNSNFAMVAAIILALLVRKGVAAELAGRCLHYTPAPRRTAVTRAATIGRDTCGLRHFQSGGPTAVAVKMLNTVFVLMTVTSILGPILTERFAPEF